MPNTKSAIRRTKRTQLQATVNRIRKSKYKSAIKEMATYLAAGNTQKAKSFLPILNNINSFLNIFKLSRLNE